MSSLASTGGPHSGIQPSERGVVEDMGRRVPNLLHGQSNAARFLIDALFASRIRRLADAGHQRQRSIQHADDLGQCDVTRLAVEDVAAPPALLALEKAMALELQEDRFQEFLRKSLPLSQFRGLDGPPSSLVCQHEQGFQAVFGLL